MIRIPAVKGDSTRIELRSPDSAANPYLMLAVCLMAGLDGIQNRIMPPARVSGNLFEMTVEEREQAGIEKLPSSLWEAIEELEKDTYICDVLGDHLCKKYIAAKREEWNQYCAQVSQWEVDQYLNKY